MVVVLVLLVVVVCSSSSSNCRYCCCIPRSRNADTQFQVNLTLDNITTYKSQFQRHRRQQEYKDF